MTQEHHQRWSDDPPAITMREMVLDHEHRLSMMEEWRTELRGAMKLVKITLGTSIASATIAIVTLIEILNTHT